MKPVVVAQNKATNAARVMANTAGPWVEIHILIHMAGNMSQVAKEMGGSKTRVHAHSMTKKTVTPNGITQPRPLIASEDIKIDLVRRSHMTGGMTGHTVAVNAAQRKGDGRYTGEDLNPGRFPC